MCENSLLVVAVLGLEGANDARPSNVIKEVILDKRRLDGENEFVDLVSKCDRHVSFPRPFLIPLHSALQHMICDVGLCSSLE